MQIGSRIKLIREINHLSPELMSEKLEISVTTYRRLETGERQPKLEELKKICHEFDVDLGFFLSTSSPICQKNTKNTLGDIRSHVTMNEHEILTNLKLSLEALVKLLEKK